LGKTVTFAITEFACCS